MPELVLKLGDNVLQNYVFDKDVMSIGRSRDNDIVVENLSVSRNHARIRRQNGKYVLTDLNSANGTYVNGVRVSKTEIVDNDIVTIGKHKLLFSDKVVDEDQVIGDAFGADRTVIVERNSVPVLCIVDGKLKGQEFQLTKFETSIGKAPSNDIVLGDDWFLGKKQAVMVRRGNAEYELHDMGGFRKSKVNGEEVKDPQLLKPGDVIEFGNTRCVFQLSSEMPEASGRVPQEMSLEDSIFSSGISYPEVARNSEAVEDERRESAFALPEQNFEDAPDAEQAFSGFDAEGLVREALGSRPNEPPTSRPDPDEDADAALFSRHSDTSEPEILLMRPDNGHAMRPEDAEAEVDAEPVPVLGDSSEELDAPSPELDAPSPQEAAAVSFSDDEDSAGEESGEPLVGGEDPPAEELEPAMAGAGSAPDVNPVSPTGGRMSRKKRRELQRQKPQEAAAIQLAPPTTESPSEEQHANNAPDLSTSQGSTDENPAAANLPADKEIALWEAALQNRSPVIRRQAAKMLKKLTGRDYEV